MSVNVIDLCSTSRGTTCDFKAPFPITQVINAFSDKTIDSCKLWGGNGFSLNVNFCVDTEVELILVGRTEKNNFLTLEPIIGRDSQLCC